MSQTNKTYNALSLSRNYLKFRITGIDKDGYFIDHPEIKVRTTAQLQDCFKRLSYQVHSIHKVYLKRHSDTKIIIGIDIQAKETFDYDRFLKADISVDFYLPRKYDDLVNDKQVWNTVKYCLLRNREILQTPCLPKQDNTNASEDDKFRHALRKQSTAKPKPVIIYKSRKGV